METELADDVDTCPDTPNWRDSRCLLAVQTHNKILMETELADDVDTCPDTPTGETVDAYWLFRLTTRY